MTERRSTRRYPITLAVSFTAHKLRGTGFTSDIASRGVLIRSTDAPAIGTRLELRIAWPCLLDGRTPLQIYATGRVARVMAGGFAVALERYEFRTARPLALEAGAA